MKKISKLLLTLSFVLSVTSSAFAVTVASWGGAYTDSQKQGYGEPTAKKLAIDSSVIRYLTVKYDELDLKNEYFGAKK